MVHSLGNVVFEGEFGVNVDASISYEGGRGWGDVVNWDSEVGAIFGEGFWTDDFDVWFVTVKFVEMELYSI